MLHYLFVQKNQTDWFCAFWWRLIELIVHLVLFGKYLAKIYFNRAADLIRNFRLLTLKKFFILRISIRCIYCSRQSLIFTARSSSSSLSCLCILLGIQWNIFDRSKRRNCHILLFPIYINCLAVNWFFALAYVSTVDVFFLFFFIFCTCRE